MPLEFRVRWEREGRQPSYRVYQTWEAACRKVRGVKAMEQVKDDTRFETLPTLVGPPALQVREVGQWRRHDYQPEATDGDREGVREWAGWTDPNPTPIGSSEVPF